MNGQLDWLWWTLGLAFVATVAIYLYVELQAYWARTAVLKTPGGHRFQAHGWSVDMLRKTGKVRIKARHAHYSQQAHGDQPAMDKSGSLDVTFEALGLRIETNRMVRVLANPGPGQDAQVPTGSFSIAFNGTEEHAVLRLNHMSARVTDSFASFAKQLQVWVERLEQQRAAQLEAEAAAKREAEEAAAKREAAKAKNKVASMTPEEQVALWRKKAGFSGSSSEIGLDGKGGIEWFVDLDPGGRITLHSNRRTAHTSLRGATITSLGGELEVTVLDAESGGDPVSFQILKGMPPDVRRAWKERLEILRDSLRSVSLPAV